MLWYLIKHRDKFNLTARVKHVSWICV